MNGYLMQEQEIVRGEDHYIESFSPENKYGAVFEDDGETGYFYAVEKDAEGQGMKVLDALHIYEAEEEEQDDAGDRDPDLDSKITPAEKPPSKLLIVWSKDWKKCALVIDGYCHAIYDFGEQAGYNINEFPPPNDFWTKGDRKMTIERLRNF